eukprot:609610-Amorphochlora_amoeboformis.AAC.1
MQEVPLQKSEMAAAEDSWGTSSLTAFGQFEFRAFESRAFKFRAFEFRALKDFDFFQLEQQNLFPDTSALGFCGPWCRVGVRISVRVTSEP